MNIETILAEHGLNPDDFVAEIKNLEGRGKKTIHSYSYMGIIDIMIDEDGRKLFRFSYNEQNGCGPMSYWWDDSYLDKKGVWQKVRGTCPSFFYDGITDYHPGKFTK